MKWNQEGTATAASLCCAHEMEPGGHSHRRKPVLCPRNGARRAQPPSQAYAVPMKWNQEGTATVASLCCAHEMEQGGHSHRRKLMMFPRNGTRRAQTPPGAYAVPMKNECLHLDRNMM